MDLQVQRINHLATQASTCTEKGSQHSSTFQGLLRHKGAFGGQPHNLT